MIWPFGVMMTSPLTDRMRVTRRVTSSTVPTAGSDTPLTEMRNDVAEAVLPFPGDEEPGADVLHEPLQAEPESRR